MSPEAEKKLIKRIEKLERQNRELRQQFNSHDIWIGKLNSQQKNLDSRIVGLVGPFGNK